MPSQPFGWFKKPITKAADLKGLKYRTVGISIDMFTNMGVSVNALPGGEIVPAMDRGLLDAAEFNNMSSDRLLGFPDVSKVCMLQSFHQNAEQFEIMFNKTKYDALPDKMKSIIANAVDAASADLVWKAIDRGLLDAAEFNNTSSDRALGFADVSKICMLQSYHQNAEQLEITFNKTKYDALPAKLKAIIAYAVDASSANMMWKAIDRNSQDYIELQTKDRVRFFKTPDTILKRQLELFDEIAKKYIDSNPLFKEIIT